MDSAVVSPKSRDPQHFAPVTTGYIVGATGSFVGAFLTAGIVLVIGIVAYIFILGRLEPIADLPAA